MAAEKSECGGGELVTLRQAVEVFALTHRFRHGTGRGDGYVMRFLSSLLSAFRFGHFVSFDLI